MNASIQFILALASGAMAVVTWHSNMPKVIAMRGRWHGFCEWILGMALALLSPALLANALKDVEAGWHFLAADAAIIAYAVCRSRWLSSQSSGSWKCSA
ncbi:hypothetical protein [Sphingopyxis sp. NJF-3]